MSTTRTIASATVFTAFVASATMAFSLSIPVTNGYFNIGEIMVYTAALLMGPYVGAFAGGVGSAISDVVLAPQFAPGTLAIKGVEGFLVGYLSSRTLSWTSPTRWRAATLALGAAVGILVGWLGTTYLSGSYEVALGFPIGPQGVLDFSVPYLFWVGLGALAFASILIVGLYSDHRVGWTALSVLVGGAEMVAGYFIYESVGLGLGYASASAEAPFNIAQAVVGLLVAVPLSRSIRRVTGRQPKAPAAPK